MKHVGQIPVAAVRAALGVARALTLLGALVLPFQEEAQSLAPDPASTAAPACVPEAFPFHSFQPLQSWGLAGIHPTQSESGRR